MLILLLSGKIKAAYLLLQKQFIIVSLVKFFNFIPLSPDCLTFVLIGFFIIVTFCLYAFLRKTIRQRGFIRPLTSADEKRWYCRRVSFLLILLIILRYIL